MNPTKTIIPLFAQEINYGKDKAFKTYDMGIQKLPKDIFIGDSVTASHMTSDPTGSYNPHKFLAQ